MSRSGGLPQVHLNLFASGCGYHSAAWRAEGSSVERIGDISWWESLAHTAERGLFDAIFVPDGQSARTEALALGPTWYLEPTTMLTAIARATEHIGVISSVSSTLWDPFHAARTFASIDHISGGRAGMNLVTSQLDAEARNHGMDALPNHAVRYARAGEFVETLKQLWASWPEDSIVADRRGQYADTSKIHAVNHADRWFRIAGPLNIPEPPQKQPVIFQSGLSEPGRDLAAIHADGVFTAAWDSKGARGFRNDVRARATAVGRNPDHIRIMPGLVLYVGSTEEEAQRHQRELNDLLPMEAALHDLSALLGIDASSWDPDAEFPALPVPIDHAATSRRYAALRHMIEHVAVAGGSSRSGDDRRRPTVREVLGYLAAGGGHATIVGTPEQVADEILRWVDTGAADGFGIMPPALPGDLTAVVDHVVPVLQARGRFRKEYTGSTLRENLLG